MKTVFKYLVSLVFLLCVLQSYNHESSSAQAKQAKKRKRKKKAPQPQSTGPINERYLEIERDLYCYSCQKMVRHAFMELRGTFTEENIFDKLAKICHWTRFEDDDLYLAQEQFKGCNVFKRDWEEKLEEQLHQTPLNALDFENAFCHDISMACENINMKWLGKPVVTMNGVTELEPWQVTKHWGKPDGEEEDQPSEDL